MKPQANDTEHKEDKNKPAADSLGSAYRELAPYLQFGWMLALSVYLMYLAGNYFDEKWDTKPWLSLAGILFALAASFYHLFKAILRTSKNQNKKR